MTAATPETIREELLAVGITPERLGSKEEFERAVDDELARRSGTMRSLGDELPPMRAKLSARGDDGAETSEPEPRSVRCKVCGDSGLVLVMESDLDAARLFLVPGPRGGIEPLRSPRWPGYVGAGCAACPPGPQLRRNLKVNEWPAEARSHRFESFRPATARQRQVIESARAWAETARHERPWLLLSGPPGRGKTHLADAAVLHLARSGCRVRRLTADTLLALIKATFDDDRIGTSTVIDQYTNAPVLMLDDIGLERPSEFATSIVAELLHARHAARLTTVMTTNIATERELAARFGERITSRLFDEAATIALWIDGPDHRRPD